MPRAEQNNGVAWLNAQCGLVVELFYNYLGVFASLPTLFSREGWKTKAPPRRP